MERPKKNAPRKIGAWCLVLQANGATVVLTTHHMSEAAALGSRIGIMLQGHLACLGTPQHLLTRYSEGPSKRAASSAPFCFAARALIEMGSCLGRLYRGSTRSCF